MISAVVPDKTAGDVFTEAMWDTYIKDNLNGLSAGGTSLPGSPIDGQVYHYVADATNGIVWQMRYRAASASSFKWEYIGGNPMRSEASGTLGTTASATYVDVGTAPQITVPRQGDYICRFHWIGSHTLAAAFGVAAIKVGGAAAADAQGVLGQNGNANTNWSVSTSIRINSVAASTLLKMQFRSGSGATMTVGHGTSGPMWLEVVPVRFI